MGARKKPEPARYDPAGTVIAITKDLVADELEGRTTEEVNALLGACRIGLAADGSQGER